MSAIDLQRQFYDMLMRSQYWSPERMQEHQRSQLGQLLHHARRTVPFYEARLDAVLRPDGGIDWDRWGEIPILTRADLQTHREAMQASELPPGHGPTIVRSSSGSTGTPVLTTHAKLTAISGDAAMARAHAWHRVDCDETYVNLTGDKPSTGAWPEGQSIGPWGPPFQPGTGEGFQLNLLATPTQQLEFLQRRRPRYVAGLPSRLRAVALEAERQDVSVPIALLMTRAEGISDEARKLFGRVFGARVLEMYSSEETTRLAFGCEAEHLHINAELVLIEIVDETGRPLPQGTRGRVLATPFYGTAQPLIRYDVGDLAALGGRCSCGRTLPVLEPVAGRVAHLFRLPDGRRFLPNVGDDYVARLGVQTWQLAQIAPQRAEFRYVAADPRHPPRDEDIAALLHVGLLAELEFVVRRFDVLRQTPEEKHISYKNEVPPS